MSLDLLTAHDLHVLRWTIALLDGLQGALGKPTEERYFDDGHREVAARVNAATNPADLSLTGDLADCARSLIVAGTTVQRLQPPGAMEGVGQTPTPHQIRTTVERLDWLTQAVSA
ncbi:hypothetical protein [uncultured Deinococcus sp.]|uniref:hypothetical protein n=1 Tax=uncultured Deinococcus sp. TaxID=158789 RepID=UPI0025858956|nr:hypothetical protein [uncultured Deinococcus sp.]